ncbi:hypothetical protein COI_0204 [Mannheimia haemolytica serotype A2 str. OVINE]|nr:hypothetical protein COI_0204 [Mannheimia haemolytica serotype A2 str. OVINE]
MYFLISAFKYGEAKPTAACPTSFVAKPCKAAVTASTARLVLLPVP